MTDLPESLKDREHGKFRHKGTAKHHTTVSTTHHVSGSLEQYELTATITSAEILSGNHIEDILISVPSQAGNGSLRVSFNGGTKFITIVQGGSLPASDLPKTQTSIYVKASTGTVDYEILLYRET